PVLFWFFAQYIPMDRYGAAARARLAEIEEEFNAYFAKHSGENKIKVRFRHYTEFAKNFQGTNREKGVFGSGWRVRGAVKFFAIMMFILWPVLVVGAFACPNYFAGKKKSPASELAGIRQELQSLKECISSFPCSRANP